MALRTRFVVLRTLIAILCIRFVTLCTLIVALCTLIAILCTHFVTMFTLIDALCTLIAALSIRLRGLFIDYLPVEGLLEIKSNPINVNNPLIISNSKPISKVPNNCF